MNTIPITPERQAELEKYATEHGQSPAELGLGEDCVQPHARELLVQMYFRWCKGGATRRHERRGAAGTCVVVGGLDAAHFHISGGMALERPDRTLSDEELDRLPRRTSLV